MCVTATWIQVLGSAEAEESTFEKNLNWKWKELKQANSPMCPVYHILLLQTL